MQINRTSTEKDVIRWDLPGKVNFSDTKPPLQSEFSSLELDHTFLTAKLRSPSCEGSDIQAVAELERQDRK